MKEWVMQRPLFGAYDTLLKELCFAEEKGHTKNPETFDESFSFIEPSSLSYSAMNSSISSFYCTLATLIRD